MGLRLEQVFAREFFAEFAVGARSVPRRSAASKEVEQLFGSPLTGSLARFVDFLGTHERRHRFGSFGWFGARGGWTVDWLPGRANALEHALGQPFRAPALLSGALPIGSDPSGNIWLVALDAPGGKNEVLLHEHDTDQMVPVADSLEAFAVLMRIVERGAAKPSAEEQTALSLRVNGSAVAQYLGLRGLTRSSLARSSDVARRHGERVRLLHVLTRDAAPGLEPASRMLLPPPRPAREASDVVAELLVHFLRGDDERFETLWRATARHPARFVRDTRRYLAARTRTEGGRKRSAPSRERGLKPPPPAPVKSTALLRARAYDHEAAGRHAQAIALLRRAVAIDPDEEKAWTALCYSLYRLARWPEMKAAALRITELEPRSSYAHQQLAIACLSLDELAESVRAGRVAVALDPKNASAAMNLAVALASLGDKEARKWRAKAIRLVPALRAAADDPENKALFERL